MANVIKIKRGLEKDINTLTLQPGELAVALDSQKLYVGDAEGNVQLVKGGAAGSVESADKLTTARTISLSGDATGSTGFDGSKNAEIALTLANSGVVAGTYTKVSVDEKGRVTTGANLSKADLPTITIEDISGLSDELNKKADATAMSTALANKVDKDGDKVLSDNNYTTAEKNKLTGIAEGAEKNKIDSVSDELEISTERQLSIKSVAMSKVSGLETALNGKANSADVYAKTETYNKEEVDAKVSSVYKYKGSVANEDALPTEGQAVGDVYNLEDTGMNVAWDGSKWDKLGSVVDLTPYLTKDDASKTYVSKEDGKGLSTNDYTTEDKNKLTGIATGAEVNKIEIIKVNDSALTITDKAVNIDLSNYATKSTTLEGYGIKDAYTKSEIDTQMSNKLSNTDIIDGGTF